MTALYFEQIASSPEQVEDLALRVSAALRELPTVQVQTGRTRHCTFQTSPPIEQWRVQFRVTKQGRATTWNDVYRAVNSVRAATYTHRRR